MTTRNFQPPPRASAKKRLVAIIPAYNEADTIQTVVRAVSRYVDQVIVIDDGSTDDTAAQAAGKAVTVLIHPLNLGQGAALQTGFTYARQLHPQVTITYDADGQFVPAEIPQLIQPILQGQAEVVLGSRFLGHTQNMPRLRRLVLQLAVLFTLIFSDLRLTDVHNGFRALSWSALTKISLRQNRMAHASEILDQIRTLGLKYQEVPVTVLYSPSSLRKGQKNTNSLRIFFDLLLSRLT